MLLNGGKKKKKKQKTSSQIPWYCAVFLPQICTWQPSWVKPSWSAIKSWRTRCSRCTSTMKSRCRRSRYRSAQTHILSWPRTGLHIIMLINVWQSCISQLIRHVSLTKFNTVKRLLARNLDYFTLALLERASGSISQTLDHVNAAFRTVHRPPFLTRTRDRCWYELNHTKYTAIDDVWFHIIMISFLLTSTSFRLNICSIFATDRRKCGYALTLWKHNQRFKNPNIKVMHPPPPALSLQSNMGKQLLLWCTRTQLI